MKTNTAIASDLNSGDESSEQYIRTFAGDMKAMKDGGKPGLTSFPGNAVTPAFDIADAVSSIPDEPLLEDKVESAATAKESLQARAVEMPIGMGDSLPHEAMGNARQYIRTFGTDEEAIKGRGIPDLKVFAKQPVVSEPGTLIVPPNSPEARRSVWAAMPTPQPQTDLSPLETYANDFREHMKEVGASTVTVLAAQQDAASHMSLQSQDPEPSSSRWYIIGGVILFLIGDFGMYYAYTRYTAARAPVAAVLSEGTPIFVDSRATVAGSGVTLAQAITQLVATSIPDNTIELVTLTSGTTTSQTILEALSVNEPGALARNTHAPSSMMGIVHASIGQSPFFILTVDSYDISFSSMLAWEKSMPTDLGVLFPPFAYAASTATSTNARVLQGFHDEVVSNHDVRVYRDTRGNSILLYGYWNKNTLVIAHDQAAFGDVLNRLATSQVQ